MRSDEERKIIPLPRSTFIIMIFCALLVLGGAVFVTSHVTRETQAATECMVELLAEHRLDNRNTHETLSQHHLDVIGDETEARLPEPPSRLPRPDDDRAEELRDKCRPYLDVNS